MKYSKNQFYIGYNTDFVSPMIDIYLSKEEIHNEHHRKAD